MLKKKIKQLYEEFKGLPNVKPIVRMNQPDDAFVILVADTIFKEFSDIVYDKNNLLQIIKIIVAPPDDGIDIFFEQEDNDESYFHIVQVKNTELYEHEISDCFAKMKRTIKSYLNNPQSVNTNIKEVINYSNFDSTYENNCIYYVVHTGETNNIKNLNEDEKIICLDELEALYESIPNRCVPSEKIRADILSNFTVYESGIAGDPKSYIVNLNGLDLATLNNKYISTEIGRNILFSNNLRDSLNRKSKTFKSMYETINNNPEKFWYYNNGITIVAGMFDMDNKHQKYESSQSIREEFVILKDFSIINGAQTTSTLGAYLKDAEINKEEDKIDKLRKVYVLARIVQIPKEDEEDKNADNVRNEIAIFNNSQNPITSRDMVSNRDEQKKLQEWLKTGEEPRIFIEIRRGEKPPINQSFYPHRKLITNEVLAQLAYSSFLHSPFKSKDKKRTLFNNDSEKKWTLNEDYHKIFNYSQNEVERGVLFRKTKNEIDELVFVAYLHKEAKKLMKRKYISRLEIVKNKLVNCLEEDKKRFEREINKFKRLIEIGNVCMFYNIALYYEFREYFSAIFKDNEKQYDYEQFYNNQSKYKEELIESFFEFYLQKCIEIILAKSDESNVNNWIRSPKNETVFLEALRDDIALKTEYEKGYKRYIDTFKTR